MIIRYSQAGNFMALYQKLICLQSTDALFLRDKSRIGGFGDRTASSCRSRRLRFLEPCTTGFVHFVPTLVIQRYPYVKLFMTLLCMEATVERVGWYLSVDNTFLETATSRSYTSAVAAHRGTKSIGTASIVLRCLPCRWVIRPRLGCIRVWVVRVRVCGTTRIARHHQRFAVKRVV